MCQHTRESHRIPYVVDPQHGENPGCISGYISVALLLDPNCVWWLNMSGCNLLKSSSESNAIIHPPSWEDFLLSGIQSFRVNSLAEWGCLDLD